MGIQNWSENIVLVDLPQEPQIGDELTSVTEIVRDRGDCDVVLDFSSIDTAVHGPVRLGFQRRYHNLFKSFEAFEAA